MNQLNLKNNPGGGAPPQRYQGQDQVQASYPQPQGQFNGTGWPAPPPRHPQWQDNQPPASHSAKNWSIGKKFT